MTLHLKIKKIYTQEANDTAVEHIRNLSRLKIEIKAIKDRIIRVIKNLCKHEQEEENYYKLVRVFNLRSNNYI